MQSHINNLKAETVKLNKSLDNILMHLERVRLHCGLTDDEMLEERNVIAQFRIDWATKLVALGQFNTSGI